jgi:mutator protein MutT
MIHHLVAGILVRDDKILLGLRSPTRAFYPDVWDMFGGHIEAQEQPEQALVRELQEELDITPTHWRELEVLRESVPAGDGMDARDLIVYFYCVTGWAGTPVNRQMEEHSTIQWFSYDEAIRLKLAHHSYPRRFAECLQMIKDGEK